jgi:hypothetical protein
MANFSSQDRRDTAALRQVGSGAAQQGVTLSVHFTASAAPYSLQDRRQGHQPAGTPGRHVRCSVVVETEQTLVAAPCWQQQPRVATFSLQERRETAAPGPVGGTASNSESNMMHILATVAVTAAGHEPRTA